jgi:hypothetical protein
MILLWNIYYTGRNSLFWQNFKLLIVIWTKFGLIFADFYDLLNSDLLIVKMYCNFIIKILLYNLFVNVILYTMY